MKCIVGEEPKDGKDYTGQQKKDKQNSPKSAC